MYIYIDIIHICLFTYYKVCGAQGWSILVYAAQAEIGEWEKAWKNLDKLDELIYDAPGGNGHSR
jgi:hypothetical protein